MTFSRPPRPDGPAPRWRPSAGWPSDPERPPSPPAQEPFMRCSTPWVRKRILASSPPSSTAQSASGYRARTASEAEKTSCTKGRPACSDSPSPADPVMARRYFPRKGRKDGLQLLPHRLPHPGKVPLVPRPDHLVPLQKGALDRGRAHIYPQFVMSLFVAHPHSKQGSLSKAPPFPSFFLLYRKRGEDVKFPGPIESSRKVCKRKFFWE